MSPAKPKKYYGFIAITFAGTFLASLAVVDLFLNPDEKDALVTLVMLVQVFYTILTHICFK